MSMVTGDIIIRLLLLTLGAYLFLFVFWKSLKDEMEERSIFAHGLIIILATTVTSIIFSRVALTLPTTRIFIPDGMWLWGGFVGFLVGSTFTWYFSPFPAYYLLEIIIPASLLWLLFVGIVFQPSLLILGAFCGSIYVLLKKYYKRFHWYRSGKMGFAALVSLSVFFALKAIIAIAAPRVISSIGQVEVLFSLSIVFLSLFSLYHLSQP